MNPSIIVSIIGEILVLVAVVWRGGALVGRLDTVIEQHETRLDGHGDQIKHTSDRVAQVEQTIAYLNGKSRR